LVKTDALVEPLAVAKILKGVVAAESPSLVIMGKQAIDDDCNQTGQMLAALTGYGQGTFASNVVIGDGSVEVTREVDGGMQTVSLKLPAIVTTDLRLNEPRHLGGDPASGRHEGCKGHRRHQQGRGGADVPGRRLRPGGGSLSGSARADGRARQDRTLARPV